MDERRATAAGITPIQPLLAEIRGIRSRGEWAAEVGRNLRRGIAGPFRGEVNSDERIPTEMIMHLRQSGLGLPDRDYYLHDEPEIAQKRAGYQAYLAQLLTLAGEQGAAERAAALL